MTDDEARPDLRVQPTGTAEAIEGQQASTPLPAEQERVPYLGFFLGSQIYGLPLQQLREVARLTRLRRIPGAPRGVAGVVNLRGEIVCALDLRLILGVPAPALAEPRMFVALSGFADPIGLVVDSVADIYSIDLSLIEPTPDAWPVDHAACFVGVVRVAEGLMGLLDLSRVVTTI